VTARPFVLGLRAVAVAGVVAMAVALGWRLAHHHTTAAQKVDSGKVVPAPIFNLPRLDGAGKLSLASLRGKAVVVNFWASDCLPCKQEMPRLEAAARRYDGRVHFVGVDIADFKGPARAFVKRYGATYSMVFDPNAVTAGPYDVAGTPQTFFVDGRGRLVSHVLGPVTDKTLTAGITRALQS
jgi:cytochrome c biogenesis protein CcmG/thiol:disulfide interchange protein DsbE